MKKNAYKIFLLLLTLISFTLIYTSCKRHHDFDDLTGGKIGDNNACTSCSTCENGVKDASETGIDCGGTSCTACTNTCTTAYNSTSVYSSGITETGPAYGSYSNTDSTQVNITVANYPNDVIDYDIYLGSFSFSSMAVGDQRVYTTTNPAISNTTSLANGQASVAITFNSTSGYYYANSGSYIYFKKVSATRVNISFCNLPAVINSQGYTFSAAVQF